jgi:fatty acid desaturase
MSGYQVPAPAGQRIPEFENLFKFVLFVFLLQLSFAAADAAVHEFGANWPWIANGALVLGFAVLNCVLMIGLGVLAHEADHRVLFRNPLANDAVGGLAAAIMLTPFYANKQFHLTHHSYGHQPGLDPEDEMHSRPFWQAAVIGSLIGLYIQYRILALNLFQSPVDRRCAGRAIKDLMFLAAAAAYFIAVPQSFGIDLRLTVLPTVLVFPLVFTYRALSDHYGVPAVARKSQRREDVTDGSAWYNPEDRIRVTGWVVLTHPLLQWLWSSVNYHEVHHKYPYLSHAHLQDVFRHTRPQVPYLVVQGYTASLLNMLRRPYYEEPARVRPFLTQAASGAHS